MKLILCGILAFLAPFILLPRAKGEESTPCEEYDIQVRDIKLHYAVRGEGKPVLLLHGNGGSHEDLTSEIYALSDAGYKVFAPDSRGQGQSEQVSEYHYADMAEDMSAFIKLMGYESMAVYGWSDGGIIALELAIKHPEQVSLLAASGANITPQGLIDYDVFVQELKAHPNPLEQMMVDEPQIDAASLRAIRIPVLITAGENDMILPMHTKLIADSLPLSTLVILEGENHGSYIVNSDIMGHLLLDFFREENY